MTRAKRTKTNFRVMGSFDMSRTQEATVTIDRGTLDPLFHVRPLRRKRAYTLPLSAVARMVTHRVIQAEIAEKKKNKRSKRAKRGLLSMR